jgi:folate-binding protein YgfZ
MLVLRRAEDDFLLLTEPDLGERLKADLLRARFAAKCRIESEEHRSTLVVGAVLDGAVVCDDYGIPACEVIDADVADASPIAADDLERLRIRAGTPVAGRELDDRVLPAEAGLEARAISFSKGCYPGQEPVARLHYRGHPNRELRVLEIEGPEAVPYDAELVDEERTVGRVTSSVGAEDGTSQVALGYVRREVARDALLRTGERLVRQKRETLP